MRDQINRGNEFAEENLKPTGHAAKEKFQRWESSINERTDDLVGSKKKDTPAQRKKKIDQMEEIVKEDIENMDD